MRDRVLEREFEKIRLNVRLNKGKIKEEMRVPCSFEFECEVMIFSFGFSIIFSVKI